MEIASGLRHCCSMYWIGDNGFLAHPDDLSAFAWSAPMRDLAARVGLSDVGLKKLLKGHGIVTPPQGYWNRIHAGRTVPGRPLAPPRQPGETGRIRLDGRFQGHVPEAAPIPEGGPFAAESVPEELDELRVAELRAIGRGSTPGDLGNPHLGLGDLLKREEKRRAKFEASQWSWDRPSFDGPLAQRQLRFLDRLFKTMSRRGHSGAVSDDKGRLSIRMVVGDMSLCASLEPAGRHATETVAGNTRPARDLPASTPLVLALTEKFRAPVRATWKDDPEGKLEGKVAAIAADLIVAGEALFRQRLVETREWEEERQRLRRKHELERIAALEAKRLEDLRRSGELLRQAEEIRSLVIRVKVAIAAGQSVDLPPEQLLSWEAWALEQADRIDPVISGQVLSHLSVPELDQ